MGFEPTTSCLGSRRSTPELHPLAASDRRPTTRILAGRRYALKQTPPSLIEWWAGLDEIENRGRFPLHTVLWHGNGDSSFSIDTKSSVGIPRVMLTLLLRSTKT